MTDVDMEGREPATEQHDSDTEQREYDCMTREEAWVLLQERYHSTILRLRNCDHALSIHFDKDDMVYEPTFWRDTLGKGFCRCRVHSIED